MTSPAAATDDSGKRYPTNHPLFLGYSAPRIFVHRIRWFSRRSVVHSIMTALLDLAIIMGTPVVAAWLIAQAPIVGIFIVPMMWVIVSRALRGLECLTHEASHYNLARNHTLNDIIGNIFAAVPTFQVVKQFRAGHLSKHHQRFGTSVDPDLRRYDELDIHSIDRSSVTSFARDILRRLPRYVGGWWWNTGSSSLTVLFGLTWHIAFYITLLSIVFGVPRALLLWGTFFVVPFLMVLPFLRLVGEAAEHVYADADADTIFTATVSNVGIIHRLFFHPHGDGFHLIHHLWPSVPHHHLKRAHRELAETDPTIFGKSRQRKSLLEEPPYPPTQ